MSLILLTYFTYHFLSTKCKIILKTSAYRMVQSIIFFKIPEFRFRFRISFILHIYFRFPLINFPYYIFRVHILHDLINYPVMREFNYIFHFYTSHSMKRNALQHNNTSHFISLAFQLLLHYIRKKF